MLIIAPAEDPAIKPGPNLASATLKSLGLVFGDIGTSPIYTLTVIFLILPPTQANVMGVVSLVFWTIMILVSTQYAWLAMSLSRKGEGGSIVLSEILHSLLKTGKAAGVVTALSYLAISLLIGDGVITPAISILSAVEGAALIPGWEGLGGPSIVFIAIVIAVLLFVFQHRGTERVAGVFGPIMLIWFVVIAFSGIGALMDRPELLAAANPMYALRFLAENGLAGFIVLSEALLCATGGEALYADMGHMGRKPIVTAWYFVVVALVLNYMGQGAYLLDHPETKSIMFEMFRHQSPLLYVPFVLLSVAATTIASQAMISGMYSVVYQAINTGIMPLMKVENTSSELRAQIYIGSVNWLLLVAVVVVMIYFGESARLAAAYGLAVNAVMVITGIFMSWIFHLKGSRVKFAVSVLVTAVGLCYLGSSMHKIPYGGYWSLLLASVPLTIVTVYHKGQRRLFEAIKPISIEQFLLTYKREYWVRRRIEGTALFFVRDPKLIPPYIIRTMFTNGIIYDDNILVNILKRDDPYGVAAFFKEDFAKGLRSFEIQMGYMEVADIAALLEENGIRTQSIFYGVEEIMTTNPIWGLFAMIKRVTPSFVHFHNMPPDKLHGVTARVEM